MVWSDITPRPRRLQPPWGKSSDVDFAQRPDLPMQKGNARVAAMHREHRDNGASIVLIGRY
jgi:hypothetical protein